MKFLIPIRLPSLANARMHWREVYSIKRDQKRATLRCMADCMDSVGVPPLPLEVTITRVSPRELDDDNLATACKHVRDQVALLLVGGKTGQYDGCDFFTWVYRQRSEGANRHYVEVEVKSRGA